MYLENGAKCKQLGWRCIPLVVETYGAWGSETIEVFSTVATRLAVRINSTKSRALTTVCGHISIILVRAMHAMLVDEIIPTIILKSLL